MDLIDFILNIAGILLWLNWRSLRVDPLASTVPTTLVGTVRRTESTRMKRWHVLLIVAGLIFVRAVFYGQIGPAVDWTPKLDLAAVSLPFPLTLRGHVFFTSALLFSALSFLRALLIFHFWLLTLVMLQGKPAVVGPGQRFLALQLGRVARWPCWVQLVLPLVTGAAAWLVCYPLLARIGVVNYAQSAWHLAGQSLLVGAAIYVSLKYVLPTLLLLHLVASYVFLGNNSFWEFVSSSARGLLAPLRRLPLRFGRVDLAPIIAIVLILLVLDVVPLMRWGVGAYFPESAAQRFLSQWILWPG